jgi:dephospho-CoA kinase
MIIGITGTSGAGKDTLAEHFVAKGFEHISLSNIIREVLQEREMEITADSQYNVGNELREKEGLGVLAKRAVRKMGENKNYVITSIRSPFEAAELKKIKNFILFSVDAPIEMRYKRVLARLDRVDKITKTFEEFKTREDREMESADQSHQQIKACMEMADCRLFNTGDREEYFQKADRLLADKSGLSIF